MQCSQYRIGPGAETADSPIAIISSIAALAAVQGLEIASLCGIRGGAIRRFEQPWYSTGYLVSLNREI